MACIDCKFWVPTEMEVYRPHAQPHEARSVAMETEMLRATHALCAFPDMDDRARLFLAAAPAWMQRRVGGGDLTKETDGEGCLSFVQRPSVEIL